MKINKLITAFVLLSTVFVSSISASATEYTVKRAVEQDEVVISGTTEKNVMFSVQILPKNLTPEAIQNDFTKGSENVFVKTLESDENGEFSFNVKIPKSGEYVSYVRAVTDRNNTSKNFIFTLSAEKASIVSTVIGKLNNGEDVDVVNYIKDFCYDDTTMVNYLEKYVNSDVLNKYYLSKMQRVGISDYNDLVEKAKKALILTVAKDSDGPANLKEVMESYKSIIGISQLSEKMRVYSDIKGEYSSIEAFRTAYNNAVNEQASSSTGGSSGGGGSNTSGMYTPSTITSTQIAAVESDLTVPIDIKFEDLSSVEWAYKDISELFDKGIVNGVSEHLFRPNNQVKREEFVKMLVCAMGLQDETVQSAGFSDVYKGAWFEKYVDIAKKYGITKGTNQNKFGVGTTISRQDMAVMIFNAMKIKGYVSLNRENTFDDKSLCANYANEAIAELNANGIVGGVGDNLFNPVGEATRAQAAVIINRALSYLG